MSMQSEMAGREAARQFMDFINSSTTAGRKEFVQEIMRSHRTLQGMAYSTMIDTMQALAAHEITGNYDARNEHAVKESKKIMNALGIYVKVESGAK